MLAVKRFGVIFILSNLLFSLVAGCQPAFQPGTYTDDMGREVNISNVPERIVSYGSSITEILFALGLGEKVVGVDDFSDYPEAVKSKPKVGDAFSPSIERLVGLEPDLVLTVKQEQLNTALDNLGVKFMVIDPTDIDGIYKNIELIGEITGVEGKASKLIDDMKKTTARVQSQVKSAPEIRVIFLIDTADLNNPWTGGHGSFIDALITMAGGENIAAEAPAPWVQFSIEQIISADPEIIILPNKYVASPQALKDHPAWQRTSAVRNNRIIIINGDLINRPGPRLVQGLDELAKIIHPELYK